MQTQLYIIENTKKKHKWEVDDSMSVSMHGVGNLNLSVSTALIDNQSSWPALKGSAKT